MAVVMNPCPQTLAPGKRDCSASVELSAGSAASLSPPQRLPRPALLSYALLGAVFFNRGLYLLVAACVVQMRRLCVAWTPNPPNMAKFRSMWLTFFTPAL